MKLVHWLLTVLILGFCSCSQNDSSILSLNIVEIAARDEGDPTQRPIVYRIKVPKDWVKRIPPAKESLMDTTKSIIEFFIYEGDAKIRMTIHNFPTDTKDQRVIPMAQIRRWKRQFQSLDEASLTLIPQAFGGYHGFLLEASGKLNDIQTSVLGWSLQLALEHYQALSLPTLSTITQRHRQMRGDVTLKAVGPSHLIAKHRESIISAARSFQLIDDIYEISY